jgi:hypothetical protein
MLRFFSSKTFHLYEALTRILIPFRNLYEIFVRYAGCWAKQGKTIPISVLWYLMCINTEFLSESHITIHSQLTPQIIG